MKATIERARQSLPGALGGSGRSSRVDRSDFRPTPNLRNPAMLLEAEDFAHHMTSFQHSLKRYQTFLHGFLKLVPAVGRSNLPRVWDRVQGGLCEPLRPSVSHQHPNWIGGDIDENLLRDTRELLASQLDGHIAGPIERWLESLASLKGRMRKLEGLRLDVDARRRRMHSKNKANLARLERTGVEMHIPREDERVGGRRGEGAEDAAGESVWEELQATGYDVKGTRGNEAKAARAREDMMRDAMYYQRKLEAVQGSYDDQERLVWEALSGLVRDAAWLKSYMAAAMNIIREALQATAIGLGPCKLPLPGFGGPMPAAAEGYGNVGDPSDVINAVPDAILHGLRGPLALTHAMDAAAAGKELHPHRITAQPLQTSADLMTPRYDPVPPVVKGASHVASDEVEFADSATFSALQREAHGPGPGGVPALTAGGYDNGI